MISKALKIPQSAVKTIIKKWKVNSNIYHHLPELGRPFKLDDQQRETNRFL